MAIWKLTPTEKASDCWGRSTYKGPVIVRAPSEQQARLEAKRKFDIFAKRVPGGDTLFNPWDQPDLVSCHRVENSHYPEDGPVEVLEPNC
jgi:hypothetical protein